MATSPINLVKLKTGATWKQLSTDGIYVGYGQLDLDWLNLQYNHNEAVDQNVYIKHFPAAYVKQNLLDPTKKFREIQGNLMGAIEKLFDNAKNSIGKLPLTPEKKNEINKEKIESPPSNNKPSNTVNIASMGELQLLNLILDGIKGMFQFCKDMNNVTNAIADEIIAETLNADGSLTVIVADYYSGTPRAIRHVGFGAISGGNTVDVVVTGKRILSLTNYKESEMRIQTKLKTNIPYIGL